MNSNKEIKFGLPLDRKNKQIHRTIPLLKLWAYTSKVCEFYLNAGKCNLDKKMEKMAMDNFYHQHREKITFFKFKIQKQPLYTQIIWF